MSLLQYSSKEMFSATDLVRKNKLIFDKLNSKEIEKAIILRDGKPSIMLLDFSEYEKIIGDYLRLKELFSSEKLEKHTSKNSNNNTNSIPQKIEELRPEIKYDKISEDEYKNAILEIEKLESNSSDFTKEEKGEALHEFWDK